jgi:hypothetical protein
MVPLTGARLTGAADAWANRAARRSGSGVVPGPRGAVQCECERARAGYAAASRRTASGQLGVVLLGRVIVGDIAATLVDLAGREIVQVAEDQDAGSGPAQA